MELWNPGKLPDDFAIDDLYRTHPSHPRNPRLAQAFYRARLIEHWGTGTLRMIQACREYDIEPAFAFETGTFQVRLQKKSVSESGISGRPRLNERQRRGLEFARNNGAIGRQDYATVAGIGLRQAVYDLNDLVEKGYLIKQGKGRATRYIPIDHD